MKEFVKKKAVIVMDSAGLPNYMTMFYMEPGTYEPEDVPELFKIRNKIVPAVLVSQFTNTMIKGVPASLPYQQPKHTISYDEAAAACGRKGKGWHLMTNTEFVYLLHEAEELGHTIGGNTNYGSNSKNEQESGVRYDSAGRTLTGCDPLTWSHDGTADGVFGLCGNFWEWVTGLRLHKGVVEYTPNNDAAVEGYTEKPDWTVAEVNGRPLKLYGNSAGDVVMSVAEEIEENWGGAATWQTCSWKNWTKCRKLRTSWELYRMTGSMKQLDFGQTANLKKACLSGVRVSTALPAVALVRWAWTAPVLSSAAAFRSVPLCSWKTGN